MIRREEIQIRDPFVLPMEKEKKYYLFGTTDKNAWNGKATGFDVYISENLQNWDGPFPAFRPALDFWSNENYWAPEVHFYNERFYMFASFKAEGKCRGTQILVAQNPSGPYIPHSFGCITPINWECLDGTFFVDDVGYPWMIFCHEWVQVHDGEICAVRLSKDLASSDGEPILLFKASEARWCTPGTGCVLSGYNDNYVTDGPFLYRAESGELLMLWSSFSKEGYAIGVARSTSCEITGPWEQDKTPIYGKDGGHGMLFKTFDGKLMLTIHTPNETPKERPIFIEVKENNGQFYI